jgi:hypothetical protein
LFHFSSTFSRSFPLFALHLTLRSVEDERASARELLSRLQSLNNLPPIPLIPHVEKLETLMREKRKDEKVGCGR